MCKPYLFNINISFLGFYLSGLANCRESHTTRFPRHRVPREEPCYKSDLSIQFIQQKTVVAIANYSHVK